MKMIKENQSTAEIHSLKDVYSAWKLHYTNRNQLLYKLHMVVLTVWLVFRYLIPLLIRQILRPVINYIRELAAEQNGSIQSVKHHK
jgi:hypothetical protein